MSDTLNVLIVDDEQLARRGLEIRLQAEPDIRVCGQCSNGREAVAAVADSKPDLVFLDIQMPGMDGFETLRQLAGPHMPAVIFVTAFAEHAIRAFEANALDYLLKPIDDLRLRKAVARAREHLENQEAVDHRSRLLKLVCDITGKTLTLDDALSSAQQSSAPVQRLAIKDGQTTACVELADIDWIEAAGDYLCIHALDQTHVLRGTMKKMEKLLDRDRFARIHRSTIINMERIQTLRSHINGEYFITLKGGKEFKLTRTYRDCLQRFSIER